MLALSVLPAVASMQLPRVGNAQPLSTNSWAHDQQFTLRMCPFPRKEVCVTATAELGCPALTSLARTSAQVMLPGEKKQLHFYEPNLVALLDSVDGAEGQLMGQSLIGDGISRSMVPVLQVVECERHEEQGVWLQVKCIGRVKGSGLVASEPFETALVGPWCDAPCTGDVHSADESHLSAFCDSVAQPLTRRKAQR